MDFALSWIVCGLIGSALIFIDIQSDMLGLSSESQYYKIKYQQNLYFSFSFFVFGFITLVVALLHTVFGRLSCKL